MKHSARFYTLIALVVTLLLPQTAAAAVNVSVTGNSDSAESHVSVNQQGSGQTTVCTNGKCTTSSGDNNSTVCINGKCTTSESGNVDVQSDDGHNQVSVHNDTEDNLAGSASAMPKDAEKVSPTSEPTSMVTPSITPDPTIIKMRDDINNKVKEQTEAVKEHMKQQEAAISAFVKSQFDVIQSFFSNLFK